MQIMLKRLGTGARNLSCGSCSSLDQRRACLISASLLSTGADYMFLFGIVFLTSFFFPPPDSQVQVWGSDDRFTPRPLGTDALVPRGAVDSGETSFFYY